MKTYVHRGGRPFWNRISARHQLVQLGLQARFVQRDDGGQQLVAEFAAERGGKLGDFLFALHPVQPRVHEILERGGDLAAPEGSASPRPPFRSPARLLHHLRKFFDEQRHAARAIVHLLDDCLG